MNTTGQEKAPIAEAMRAYAADGALAFHTPGHKQGRGAHPLLRQLITEEGLREEVSLMEELDDLHEPTMCIREAQELAAELYGADAAWFMINGTTGANHTMLLGTLRPGDTVLLPRNAHRSLIGACILAGVRPVWLQPEVSDVWGIAMGVPLAEIQAALAAHPEARALVLVYPTYYGVTQDLRAVADYVHERGVLLLVDAAHGPHLHFSDELPLSALDAGADVVASSTHKITGSLTQTSMLFVKGPRVEHERIRQAASLLQSTSPNQLLLASLDIARLQLYESGRASISRAVALAQKLRGGLAQVPGLRVLMPAELHTPGATGLDLTKITVQVSGLGLSGTEAEHILRHAYKIQCELSDASNLLFIISYADDEETCGRLLQAMQSLAATHQGCAACPQPVALPTVPPQAMAPREAFFAPVVQVPFAAAVGRVAAEQVMFYPPGIPLLVPGDRITGETLHYIHAMQALGLKVVGPADASLQTLQVIAEEKLGDSASR
jgi:arginine/lysine/ornithine decarboxylase